MPDHAQPSDSPATTDPFARPVGLSRYAIVLAIVGTLLSALSILLFGVIVAVLTVFRTFRDGPYNIGQSMHFTVDLIELTDLFLFGMVLYVVAVGMYQLFIDTNAQVPEWMRVRSLADLKTQLLNVVVVLLAVTFLATAVSWKGEREILAYGAGIAVVVAALALYNLVHQRLEHVHPGGKGGD